MSGEETSHREKCSHKDCSKEQRIWLPETITSLEETKITSSTDKSDVSLHHWCVHCGCVQNISDDRPKKIGYWINVLSQMARERPLTQCQKRLIIKALESNEFFEDMYATTGSAQQRVFVKVVQNYSTFGENTIDSFIF